MNDKVIKLVDKNGTRPFKQRQWNRVQNLGGWAQSLKGQVGHVACI